MNLRSFLSNLAAFAVGAGLAAAWHLSREEADLPQENTTGASERGGAKAKPGELHASAGTTDSEEMASSTDEESVWEAPAAVGRLTIESPMYPPGSPGFAAEQRRNRRLEALELTFLLGLSTAQSVELEGVLLREAESRQAFSDWLTGNDAKTKWLRENLTAQQAETYNQNNLAKVNESYESAALDEVQKMARVLDLTPEQRFDLLAALTRKNMILSSGTVVEIIVPEGTSEASPPVSGPSEKKILPPVREIGEILTPEQWSRYQEFLRGEEELRALKSKELTEVLLDK